MKKRTTAFFIASMMTMTAISPLMVFAEETVYALGDVDMDGVVTGHDTAMISRYLSDETYTFTEQQLLLADVNADGTVDQTDADTLYNDMQVYHIGDVDMSGNGKPDISLISDASLIVDYSVKPDEEWNQVQINLADADLDGNITISDAAAALRIAARYSAELPIFDKSGKYYFDLDFYTVGDVNMDDAITIEDATDILTVYAGKAASILTEGYLHLLSDIDSNGKISISDAAAVLTKYAEAAAGLN